MIWSVVAGELERVGGEAVRLAVERARHRLPHRHPHVLVPADVHLLLLEHRLEHPLLGAEVELRELEPVAVHAVAETVGLNDVPLELERRAVGTSNASRTPSPGRSVRSVDHADAAGREIDRPHHHQARGAIGRHREAADRKPDHDAEELPPFLVHPSYIGLPAEAVEIRYSSPMNG